MFQAIPQRIKTLWGWSEDNENDREAIAIEYDRLADYTRKAEPRTRQEQQPSSDDDF